MNGNVRGTSLAFLLLSLAVPASGQNYFLYTPQPVKPAEKTAPKGKDGVLVQEVEVRKGDTLFGISRRFSGRGSYYPQILLFNDIKNPHMIHGGETVRVPVVKTAPAEQPKPREAAPPPSSRKAAAPARPVGEIPISDLKQAASSGVSKSAAKNRARKQRARKHASGRRQFRRAMVSYRRGEWSRAIEQFDRFLAANPSSRLAADASLYKADCYMKLSDQ